MIFSHQKDEIERFKLTFADELLEFHFERTLGKNEYNGRQWRVLLDERIEPHAEILCDFSNWLLARGWSRETVEEMFFVAINSSKAEETGEKQKAGIFHSFLKLFKP